MAACMQGFYRSNVHGQWTLWVCVYRAGKQPLQMFQIEVCP